MMDAMKVNCFPTYLLSGTPRKVNHLRQEIYGTVLLLAIMAKSSSHKALETDPH